MSGKTNLILGIASTILLSIGSITTINTLSFPYVGIVITVCGAIGLGLREYLKPKASTGSNPQ